MTESKPDIRAENRARLKRVNAVLKAVSHPTRRQILAVLKFRGGEMTAGEIADRFSCAWPTVTRHLGVLRSAGLIRVERDGRNLRYRLDAEPLRAVWQEWVSVVTGA